MNFSKFGIEKRQQKLSSHGSRNASRVFVGVFKIVLIAFVFVMVVLAGAGFGMLKGILDDSPDVSSINIKPKGFKTTIYDQEGNVLDTLSTANSNRIYIYYDEIPKEMIVLVVEDDQAQEVVATIEHEARTDEGGAFGDGKVFMQEVLTAFTVSTGKEGL